MTRLISGGSLVVILIVAVLIAYHAGQAKGSADLKNYLIETRSADEGCRVILFEDATFSGCDPVVTNYYGR